MTIPHYTIDDLVAGGALPAPVLNACVECICESRNILVTGPVAAGKTTLLCALAGLLPGGDDVLVIDAGGGFRAEGAGCRRVERRGGQTPDAFRDAVGCA